MKYIGIILALTFAVAAYPVDLQTAYNNCGPGNGYDKYLVLDPNVTYTGSLTVIQGKKSCIEGNGALIIIDPSKFIKAQGNGTRLDIDHAVLCNNGTGKGLVYVDKAVGTVNFCTINNFEHGVYLWGYTNVTLKNSVITNNTVYGVAKQSISLAYISYVDAWGNDGGNYYEYCEG